MTQETVIEKIKKIIAKAKGTDNESEANAFMAKASTLLIKHGLAIDEVENEDKPKATYEKGIIFGGGSEEGLWEDSLLSVIAIHNLCEAIIHSRAKTITLIGRKENIEIAKYMYSVSRDIMRRGRSKRYSAYKKAIKEEYPEHTEKELLKLKIMQYSNPFRRSYLKGAVAGLHIKLTKERADLVKKKKDQERSVSNTDTFAVALKELIDLRVEENTEVKDDLFKDVGESKVKLKDSPATRMGKEDGQSIQLSAGLTAGDEAEAPKLLN